MVSILGCGYTSVLKKDARMMNPNLLLSCWQTEFWMKCFPRLSQHRRHPYSWGSFAVYQVLASTAFPQAVHSYVVAVLSLSLSPPSITKQPIAVTKVGQRKRNFCMLNSTCHLKLQGSTAAARERQQERRATEMTTKHITHTTAVTPS